jgi:hypothetical protein
MEVWPTLPVFRAWSEADSGTGGEYPAAQRANPSLPLGAKRAAAADGCVIPDDSGSEEERDAGGPGLEPPILGERGALTYWMAKDYDTCNGHRLSRQAES